MPFTAQKTEFFIKDFFKETTDLVTFTEKILYAEAVTQEVFCKKGVLKNFAKFTGKHLCQSLFFIEEILDGKLYFLCSCNASK